MVRHVKYAEGCPKISCEKMLKLVTRYRFRYRVTQQFARREAARFQRGRERVEPRISGQAPVVNKVYVVD